MSAKFLPDTQPEHLAPTTVFAYVRGTADEVEFFLRLRSGVRPLTIPSLMGWVGHVALLH